MTDIERLLLERETLFQLTETGRIERENDPDHSPGARLWLAGCASGNVSAVRRDVGDKAYADLVSLLASEPPLTGVGSYPRHFERYLELLTENGVVPKRSLGLIYDLPNDLAYPANAPMIDSDSDEGARLYEKLSAKGMPDGLRELGFHTVADLWAPWCMALEGGEIASIAFASRLCATGAELGLATVSKFRGRGYGAIATAGWTRLLSLRPRTLFYSTEQTNLASQRVIQKLRLRYIGSSLRLT